MSGDALLEKLRHVTVYLTGDADAKLYTVQPNPPKTFQQCAIIGELFTKILREKNWFSP